ncbi:MAG: Mur ligase family protein [Chitinophagaceae bacterium]|nr:Mur ligase family protein [Chitinophagaceae bacterium]
MIPSLQDAKHIFFIGIAGSGMSALAQYLHEEGKLISGSDRFFSLGENKDTLEKLEALGIRCYPQDGSGMGDDIDLVVASSAVEDTVTEVQLARQRGIPLLKRSELLSLIVKSRKTIAIAGTSGKSTTAAMLFDILDFAGLQPGIISGAGLTRMIRKGKIGNACRGRGEWLVIEADESDGSLVQYEPELGVLLNIDKDHYEVEELKNIFHTFRSRCKSFIVNASHPEAATLSLNALFDFSAEKEKPAGITATEFVQQGVQIRFKVNEALFTLNALGRHNMENALAAVAAAKFVGISPQQSAEALKHYEGIYRRMQIYGQKNGVWLIDDYAHNPVKCAAALKACHPVAPRMIAWFQPHGYKPTKFLRHEYVKHISAALRDNDEIWMSEIFYAGGTAQKDISAADLIHDLREAGRNAYFIENRNDFSKQLKSRLTPDCVVLLMGARDPSLQHFAETVWQSL